MQSVVLPTLVPQYQMEPVWAGDGAVSSSADEGDQKVGPGGRHWLQSRSGPEGCSDAQFQVDKRASLSYPVPAKTPKNLCGSVIPVWQAGQPRPNGHLWIGTLCQAARLGTPGQRGCACGSKAALWVPTSSTAYPSVLDLCCRRLPVGPRQRMPGGERRLAPQQHCAPAASTACMAVAGFARRRGHALACLPSSMPQAVKIAAGTYTAKTIKPGLDAQIEPGNPGGYLCGCAAIDSYMNTTGQWEGDNWKNA